MKDCDIDDDLYDALVKSGKYSDDEDKKYDRSDDSGGSRASFRC